MFVHGFNESYYRVISHLCHLKKRIAQAAAAGDAAAPSAVSIVGFTWPSHTGSLASGSYYGARAATAKAGRFLRLALAMLAARGNRVVLVAHSLGSRVALHALLDWPAGEPAPAAADPDAARGRAIGSPVDELHLAAPGVASDALAVRGEFPSSRLATPSVTVYHSKRDAFLQGGFWVAEAGPAVVRGARAYRGALGAFGMSGDLGPGGKAKCEAVDCTAEVGSSHSIHAYINLFIFSTRILASAMRHDPPQASLTDGTGGADHHAGGGGGGGRDAGAGSGRDAGAGSVWQHRGGAPGEGPGTGRRLPKSKL